MVLIAYGVAKEGRPGLLMEALSKREKGIWKILVSQRPCKGGGSFNVGTSIDLNVTERGIKNWKASIGSGIWENTGVLSFSALVNPQFIMK